MACSRQWRGKRVVITHSITRLTVPIRLKEARIAKRLSLARLARLAGTTKAHVWDLEQGRATNPTLSTLKGLSSALGVPIHVLVGESDSSPADQLEILCRELRELEDCDLSLVEVLVKSRLGV